MDGFNIASLFMEQARKHPERLAIADKQGTITFSQLASQVQAQAAAFERKGLKAGDRVLVFVPMSRELYVHVLALFYMGATAVFMDEWVSISRLNLCCKIAQCRGFIAPWKFRWLARFLSSDIRRIPLWFSSAVPSVHETKAIKQIDQSCDTALITFTTGSTGTPKAAKRTHHFLRVQFNALMEKIQPEEGDVDMPVLPIVLMLNLGCGVPSLIPDWKSGKPQLLDPKRIWAQMQAVGVNRITSSPYFMLRMSQFFSSQGISTLHFRKLFTGGAPVFPNEAAEYRKAFPSAQINIVFGSTEAEPISSIDADSLVAQETVALKKGLPVGEVHSAATVRIITWKDDALQLSSEEELHALMLPQGEVGEIIVSGEHVLREYYNNEEALKRNKIFIGNACWHRTGDSGFIDENGKLFLTGRCKYMRTRNGELVSPFLIENRMQYLPGIVCGTVVHLNHKSIIVVQPQEEQNEKSTKSLLEQAGLAMDEIMIVDEMPKDKRHFSKIDYEALLEKISKTTK